MARRMAATAAISPCSAMVAMFTRETRPARPPATRAQCRTIAAGEHRSIGAAIRQR
jgi:hypothetical protein